MIIRIVIIAVIITLYIWFINLLTRYTKRSYEDPVVTEVTPADCTALQQSFA